MEQRRDEEIFEPHIPGGIIAAPCDYTPPEGMPIANENQDGVLLGLNPEDNLFYIVRVDKEHHAVYAALIERDFQKIRAIIQEELANQRLAVVMQGIDPDGTFSRIRLNERYDVITTLSSAAKEELRQIVAEELRKALLNQG